MRLILRLKEEIFLKPMFESGESERLTNTNWYPFIHLGGEEHLWDKFLAQEKFQRSGRDSNPGPLDPSASVLPLDHCSHLFDKKS
ncbi:hypothetical protein DPMN_178519 [Dreissena polymorpha]|uniref:Uncharacterized protein n=1 Tax=Dreissena polymorpha TaxID=45954 RepID=A0A9D4IIR4_DREPO|nr:hypothetical protein DPMN_178519 [Dreissena polymorpha]